MFAVSSRTQYGIRALAYLAGKENREAIGAEIAEAEAISPKYLEGILTRLALAGLIHSERGKNGGYRLTKAPEEIHMSEVVAALEGEVRPVDCVIAKGICSHDTNCGSRGFWIGLKAAIDGYLTAKTLGDVIARKKAKTTPGKTRDTEARA